MDKPKTLFDKIWDAHRVYSKENYPDTLYIDAHFIHEVTSPQAFAGLQKRGLQPYQIKKTYATADHNVPTVNQHLPIKDVLSRKQVALLEENCKEFGISLYGLGDPLQGIVHVIGPELGITQPGMTLVCGDSHTSTHGAFGTVAFGIGTSEVEQVLATQCVLQQKPKKMKVQINGTLSKGVTAKDMVLHIISQISSSGATGYFVEYAGEAVRRLSMEGRMTICNMSIEMGARGGLVAPDDTTFFYVKGRKFAPQGSNWKEALKKWKLLFSDEGAVFDKECTFNVDSLAPMITYGTNPGMGMVIDGTIPLSESIAKEEKSSFEKALNYMALEEGKPLLGKPIDYVFIGSCTNSRIEDLREVAFFLKGKRKHSDVVAWIVPGSQQVRRQACEEKLDLIFEEAGIQFREPGCSACLGMNEDKVPAGKYCISTSNRNFEGRQGPKARTMLASPLTAAAAAVHGCIVDVREYI